MANFELETATAEWLREMMGGLLEQGKATTVAIAPDGRVEFRALQASLPWYRADITIAGTAVNGVEVARVSFPQGASIRHISISARTAPTGAYSLRLRAGANTQTFSLQPGTATGMTSLNLDVPASSWLMIDVTGSGGAANVDISIHYIPGVTS